MRRFVPSAAATIRRRTAGPPGRRAGRPRNSVETSYNRDVSALIIAIWYAGVAAKAFAAYRIIVKDLFYRLPIFWVFIVLSVGRSLALAFLASDPRRYAEIAADTMPMMLLSEGFAIASVFWLLTENFPKWRKPGTISLSVLAMLGASAALLLRTVAVPTQWGYGWADAWE